MQINAIGVNPKFTGSKHSRDRIDDFINLDDNSIKEIALVKTMESVDTKKQKKISNALFYSVPFAAGLVSAILTKNTSLFNKKVSGLTAKATNGLVATGYWCGLLATIKLVSLGKNYLSDKSERVNKFDRQHPFLSFLATLAAGVATISLGTKGINVILKNIKPKTVAKVQKRIGNIEHSINNNKTLSSISESIGKKVAKVPSAIKGFVKTILPWTPDALLIGGIIHSVNSGTKINREFAKNYGEIKDKQFELSQARLNELKELKED